MKIYEQIIETLKDRIGTTLTASEIKNAVTAKYGTNVNSVIPSDYCYNRFNSGILFDKHIFEYINQNSYKYLGERYLFTGLIYHKPANQNLDFIVGEWIAGRKIFYSSPVRKDSAEGLSIVDHASRMVVTMVDSRPSGIDTSAHLNHNSVLPQLYSATQIKDLISRADDYEETKRLIAKLDGLKRTKTPYSLNIDNFDEILHWKLRRQYSRQERNIQLNTDELVRKVTTYAFSVSGVDDRDTIRLMLKALIILHGVQIPVASAIMTLCFPDKYCVIDFRGWRQVYGKVKKYGNYSIREYIDYWSKITNVALKFGVMPQEVDMSLWQFDIESRKK
jgi:hypothetical protein